jgi:hypothetical protein
MSWNKVGRPNSRHTVAAWEKSHHGDLPDMSREARIELAWDNFLRSERTLIAYVCSRENDPVRHKQLTEAVKTAMDEVLDQISLLCVEPGPAVDRA